MSDKITKLRQQINDKKSAISDLENAGLPPADVMALLQENFDIAAADYLRSIEILASNTLSARKGLDVEFNRVTGLVFDKPDQFIMGALLRHLGLQITSDVQSAMALAQGNLPPGVSDQQRTSGLKQLRRELLTLERAEEAEIEAAHLCGNQIDRRPDADPVAVLGVPSDVLEKLQ